MAQGHQGLQTRWHSQLSMVFPGYHIFSKAKKPLLSMPQRKVASLIMLSKVTKMSHSALADQDVVVHISPMLMLGAQHKQTNKCGYYLSPRSSKLVSCARSLMNLSFSYSPGGVTPCLLLRVTHHLRGFPFGVPRFLLHTLAGHHVDTAQTLGAPIQLLLYGRPRFVHAAVVQLAVVNVP